MKEVGDEFADYIARCAGLVASPSPGTVTQALACGKPCYLICPPGHLEQQFNQEYYFKNFIGIHSHASKDINEWAEDIDLNDDSLIHQAIKLRNWISSFDLQAEKFLIPALEEMMGDQSVAVSSSSNTYQQLL